MDNIKLDELFHQAKTETPKVSFKETKAEFTHSVNQLISTSIANGASSLFTTKIWTIMITTLITTITIGAYLLIPNTPNDQSTIPVQELEIELTASQKTEIKLEKETVEPVLYATPKASVTKIEANESFIPPVEILASAIVDTSKAIFIEETKTDTEYRFPVLTLEEREANEKEKLLMAKVIGKSRRKVLFNIPYDRVEREGKLISSDPFYIYPTEVTNLQYRTFLFDLLIQDKKEAFLIAKPDQSLWNIEGSVYSSPMVEMYFSHPTYNYYPVNNISREGAEMYCTWLTTQVNAYLSKKGKPLINNIRLPSDKEWIYAARGAINKSDYPWGGPYARNSKGCYLANFSPEEAADADGSFFPVAVYSYSPNDYGLYCMSGNVAEMVYYDNDKTKPGTQGGSWNSTVEEIKIQGEDKFKGITTPNVNIGFRWVIPRLKDQKAMGYYNSYGEFQYPKLSAKELEMYAAQKKKMMSKAGDYKTESYSLFLRDTLSNANDSIRVADYLMQTTEVTNLQYRTFLIDLMNQSKKADYILALPDQMVWETEVKDPALSRMYFWHPAYNNYPIVGVTSKGVALYCAWFTEEGLNRFYANSPDFSKIQMRLPTKTEWEYAASENGKHTKYPWQGNSLKDKKGEYLTNCYPTKGKYVADGAHFTNTVKAYPPNGYNLYNLCGNVAELVTVSNNELMAKGGNWASTPEEIQIFYSNESQKDVSPSTKIGFRPLIVFEYYYDISSLKKRK